MPDGRGQDFAGRRPCVFAGVPGLSEKWVWMPSHGASVRARASTTVARPGRSKRLPSSATPLDVQGALRPDLRILVMPATLDGARVARLLDGARVIEAREDPAQMHREQR